MPTHDVPGSLPPRTAADRLRMGLNSAGVSWHVGPEVAPESPLRRVSWESNPMEPSSDPHAYPYESPAQMARRAGRTHLVGLADWWRRLAEQEIADTVPKAIEYGATDLIDIGRVLARISGRTIDDAEAAELGCWFYLTGKMSRAVSALERGAQPSADTLKDIGIYVKMVQRIRSSGGWPGEEMDDDAG